MKWIDKEITYFFHQVPVTPGGDFFQFLEDELPPEVDIDDGVFSGIFEIDGNVLGWFEERIVLGFEKDIREKVNPNGSWVKLNLKYLYSMDEDGGDEFKKFYYNGESLFGN